MGTVGKELRAARLRRGEDLATVSRALKICRIHLNALEEDQFEALPGRTYAVGFVRSYAEHLGLDAPAAVERFKQEIVGRSDGTYQVTLVPDTDERRLPLGWIVMAVVLVAIVAYAGYHLTMSADTLLRQPVTPVPARIAPRPPATTFVRPAPPRQSAAARTAPTILQADAKARPGQVSAAVSQASPAGQHVAAPPTTVASPPGATGPATPSPNPQVAALPKGQEYGIKNTDARIILHAKASTRVLVQGPDGKVFINRILSPGDSFRVPDEAGLTLTTPNGGAVALELDGQDMGVAGKDGQVMEGLPLDPQTVMDRFNQDSPGQGG